MKVKKGTNEADDGFFYGDLLQPRNSSRKQQQTSSF